MAADYSDAMLRRQNPYAALMRVLPALAGTLLFAVCGRCMCRCNCKAWWRPLRQRLCACRRWR